MQLNAEQIKPKGTDESTVSVVDHWNSFFNQVKSRFSAAKNFIGEKYDEINQEKNFTQKNIQNHIILDRLKAELLEEVNNNLVLQQRFTDERNRFNELTRENKNIEAEESAGIDTASNGGIIQSKKIKKFNNLTLIAGDFHVTNGRPNHDENFKARLSEFDQEGQLLDEQQVTTELSIEQLLIEQENNLANCKI